jgi:hypothetical protein
MIVDLVSFLAAARKEYPSVTDIAVQSLPPPSKLLMFLEARALSEFGAFLHALRLLNLAAKRGWVRGWPRQNKIGCPLWELGHCSMQSACLKRAKSRRVQGQTRRSDCHSGSPALRSASVRFLRSLESLNGSFGT